MTVLAFAKGTLDAVLQIVAADKERDVLILKLAADPASEPELKAEALVWLKRENASDQARKDRWERVLDRFNFWDNDKPEDK